MSTNVAFAVFLAVFVQTRPSVAVQWGRVASLRQGASTQANPLLADEGITMLAAVRPEHVTPAIKQRLAEGAALLIIGENKLRVAMAERNVTLAYEDVMGPLHAIYQSVGEPWNALIHLKAVKDSEGLRNAVENLRPIVTSFWQNVSQSKVLYDAFRRIRGSPEFDKLPEAPQRAIKKEVLDRQMGGVGLQGAAAQDFNKIQKQLGNLSAVFTNNVLDARKAWNITIYDPARVAGIPERALIAAADIAKVAGHHDATKTTGPWCFTLDSTILGPVLTYADDRALREELYRAFVTLASAIPYNNEAIVAEILQLRLQESQLLGYKNYALLSFASKMATRDEVHQLLDELHGASKSAALREDAELREFALAHSNVSELNLWDRPYFVQKLQRDTYGFDGEALRVYFPFAAGLDGVFSLAGRLFGVSFKRVPEGDPRLEAIRWHKDVLMFDVLRNGECIGSLLVDPYSRPDEKRAGAWMQPLVDRRIDGSSVQLPVAAVVTNFPPPISNGANTTPSLLSFDEVGTLFHEFGHSMQHVLTTQNDSAISGINGIEWDAVEVASQFFEYWVEFDRQTLFSFARHYSTGDPLPENLYQKIKMARNFRAASALLAQIYLAETDLMLHEDYKKGDSASELENSIARQVLVVQPLPQAKPLCSFSHIFAGGYAAGYYSYLWSQVLSADAFGVFENDGGLQDPSRVAVSGTKFAQTLLGVGGGRDPALVFRDFRGRAPSVSPLLHYSGLSPPTRAPNHASVDLF